MLYQIKQQTQEQQERERNACSLGPSLEVSYNRKKKASYGQ
jgi:hypothetical protein